MTDKATGTTRPDDTRIVVGVDGSDSAQAALRWAVRQAKLTGGRVEAVSAWHYPTTVGWEALGVDADFEGIAREILSEALTAVDGLEPGVTVLSQVAEGYPAEVLLDAAKGADLLVLGNRGHGGLRSALIGSVSLHCVTHAHCPVLVVREEPGEVMNGTST
jgi:nucleotide-binding universal stress UspA family protein